MQRSQGPWNSDSFLPGEQIKKKLERRFSFVAASLPLALPVFAGYSLGGGNQLQKEKAKKKEEIAGNAGFRVRVES